MNTPASTLLPPRFLVALLIVSVLVSMTIGAIAGTLSLAGTVLAAIAFGLVGMVSISVKGGNTSAASAAQLMVSVGIICVPLGAIVTALAR